MILGIIEGANEFYKGIPQGKRKRDFFKNILTNIFQNNYVSC